MSHGARASRALAAVREQGPLVHNITNYVSMDIAANALLAVGASPLMAHAREEVADIVAIAGVVVINIGTLSPAWIEAMRDGARAAVASGKPWVLDPVGVGATPYRTNTARELAAMTPRVIRGNASEIMALAGEHGHTKGVDSTQGSDAAREAAAQLARGTGAVVAVTGAVDYITDGERLLSVRNGDASMSRITALGCSTSALVGAFLVVHDDAVEAAAYAIALMGVCGERGARGAAGPASLRTGIIDALHAITPEELEAEATIEG